MYKTRCINFDWQALYAFGWREGHTDECGISIIFRKRAVVSCILVHSSSSRCGYIPHSPLRCAHVQNKQRDRQKAVLYYFVISKVINHLARCHKFMIA